MVTIDWEAAYKALWKDRDEQEHLRAEYFRRLMAAEKQLTELRELLAPSVRIP